MDDLTQFTFPPNSRQLDTKIDAIGVLEHEVSELMGRTSFLGTEPKLNFAYLPLDLFRYSPSPFGLLLNRFIVNPSLSNDPAAEGFFSIDAVKPLWQYDNHNASNGSPAAGDFADWINSTISDS